jgi:TorA maturation chaperone TorD
MTDDSIAAGPPVEEALRKVVTAIDLLAHFWSRPIMEEIHIWIEAVPAESATHQALSSEPDRDPLWRPEHLDDSLSLLVEHERLFVGPGRVPCPPYESFWREDVPVELRRSRTGPCTADLEALYAELGLKVAPGTGPSPDHIAVELEALAFALSAPESLRLAERLLEHLCQWTPRFCRAVMAETRHGYYRDLAEVTLEWLGATASVLTAATSPASRDAEGEDG